MSEYQYYEFVAVDRPLDPGQMDRLRALSSRARITPTGFTNSYHWGDFRGDPQELVERYFDAFLYLANWGTHRVMLRLPVRLLTVSVASRYCVGESARAWRCGEWLVLDLSSREEEGDWEQDGEGLLAGIVPVRAELASGDLRALYLAWLACAQTGEVDPDEAEPPVPPGLGSLSAAQSGLAEFLRVDPDLLAVAAAASPPLMTGAPSAAQAVRWVADLPAEDKDAALARLLCGDDPHVRAELLRRYRGEPSGGAPATGDRTAGRLLAVAQAREAERRADAARRQAAEQARRERAAAQAREQHLAALAGRQDQAWQQVTALIDTKRPKDYDAAVSLLSDLREVCDRAGTGAAFARRLRELHQQHQRKPSLIARLDQAGLSGAGSPGPGRDCSSATAPTPTLTPT